MSRLLAASLIGAAALLSAADARAVDIPNVGGKRLSIDVSNTTVGAYRFDNRNDVDPSPSNPTIVPQQHVDDEYGEWLNRLYIRAKYWKFSLGVRMDSAVFIDPLSREDAQNLIVDKLGAPNLDLENRFGRELHSRYTSFIYPAKLWLAVKHKGFKATLGDFYAQLGRGLIFSARKLDEVGIDTTVRGGKLRYKTKIDEVGIDVTAFGGQLNPIRIDFPTGRVMNGSGSPLFFGFPKAADFQYYTDLGGDQFQLQTERARPNYLEDGVAAGSMSLRTKYFQITANNATIFRQGNSLENLRCTDLEGRPEEDCAVEFPVFANQDNSRAHDLIHNFSQSIRIPQVAGVFDAYVEVAEQRHTRGRVLSINPNGTAADRLADLDGFALYANVNISAGPIQAVLQAKHYERFLPISANTDAATLGFGAPEFSILAYSSPPTTEHIFLQPIGSPNVCITGARAKVDARINEEAKLYGWYGNFTSYSEIDALNQTCKRDDELRTDTHTMAVGTELDFAEGTHYWFWIGGRLTDRAVAAVANSELNEPTSVFYREGYIRYDLNQSLAKNFSLSLVGNHRRRLEPKANVEHWHTGENLLALNWNPNWSFVLGHEYTTLVGFPTHYFNGAVQWRAKSEKEWYHRAFNAARIFVGQRRAALRCVSGVCRIYPAFEGARLELVSRF